MNLPLKQSPVTPLEQSSVSCDIEGEYLPSYSQPGDAGADLQSSTEVVIPARGKKLIPTGIRISLPKGHVGLIWPRSGLAFKFALDCGAGVIDSQYRGEIKVLMFNHSDEDYRIKKGERVAQLLIQKVETATFIKVDALDSTRRGQAGFGSTGE